MTDLSKDELIYYHSTQARYWRELAGRLNQELTALKNNTPHTQKYTGIDYKDPTGNQATTQASRKRQ